jgi:hypothetical protein
MTNGILDNPQVGDLVMDYEGDVGVITLADPVAPLYYVLWSSGYLTGYTTAHKPKEIRAWTKNVRLQLDKL